jgi:predicted NBD/HSP70 family sugar kinase
MTAGQRDAAREGGGFRIGVDLGGTKIEVLAIDREGRERHRQRVPTPQGDYEATIDAIAGLVAAAESELGERASVGVGTPGSISRATGHLRGANSVCLNGRPIREDLSRRLGATCASPTTRTASRCPRRPTARARAPTSSSA